MAYKTLLAKYSVEDGKNTLKVHCFQTPFGKMVACADENYLYFFLNEDSKHLEKKLKILADELDCKFLETDKCKTMKQLEDELNKYFEGKLKKFNVPLKMIASDFHKEVWTSLLDIPYGTTKTYGEQCKAIGKPANNARALGGACGANSFLLIVPCHRLVGASDKKGGYVAGVNRKEWLLKHESSNS